MSLLFAFTNRDLSPSNLELGRFVSPFLILVSILKSS